MGLCGGGEGNECIHYMHIQYVCNIINVVFFSLINPYVEILFFEKLLSSTFINIYLYFFFDMIFVSVTSSVSYQYISCFYYL